MRVPNIAKNTSFFTLSLILQKIISFTYFVLLARYLGPADLGKYYFAISFTSLFSIFIDWGLANITTREVAKKEEAGQQYLSLSIALKIPLSFLMFFIVMLIAYFSNYSNLIRNLIYLSSFCMILDSFSLTFFSILRGYHNLKYESSISVFFQIIVLSSGLIFMQQNKGPLWLMGSLVLASMLMFLFSGWIIFKKYNLKLKPNWNKIFFKQVFLITLPFAIFIIFQKIYSSLDTIILAYLKGDEAVGLYQSAFKITNALQFLPSAFIASLYPAFSLYWKNNKNQLTISFERAMNYLIIISLPISIGISALADKIILIFGKDYASAILTLQISMLALIFIFLNYPIGSILNACDKQKKNTHFMGWTLLISIFLNFILIKKYGVNGASLTMVISNLLMFFLGIKETGKIIDYSRKKIILVLVKVISASSIMLIFILITKNLFNIFSTIFLASIIYFSALFILKGFQKKDLSSILMSLKIK